MRVLIFTLILTLPAMLTADTWTKRANATDGTNDTVPTTEKYGTLPLRIWVELDTPSTMYAAELPNHVALCGKKNNPVTDVSFTGVDGITYQKLQAEFEVRFCDDSRAQIAISFKNTTGQPLELDPNRSLSIHVGTHTVFQQQAISQDGIAHLAKVFNLRRTVAAGIGLDIPSLEWVVAP